MSAYVSFLTVLGWSLLDSIWQMAVLWMAYYILTAGNIRISSAGKHNLILVFVFIGLEWFVYTLVHLINDPVALFSPGLIPVSSPANLWIPCLSTVYLGVLIFRFFQYAIQSYTWNKKRPGKILSSELQSTCQIWRKQRRPAGFLSLLSSYPFHLLPAFLRNR
jgi:hypothetical protein